jgi:tellurite resistance protein TehA-like permease
MVLYPNKVWKEWVDPVKSTSFLFFTMSLLILSSGISLDRPGSDAWRDVAKTLFWVSAPLQLAISLHCLTNWMIYMRAFEHVSPQWLAVPVANVFAALTYTQVYRVSGEGASELQQICRRYMRTWLLMHSGEGSMHHQAIWRGHA